VGDDPDMRGNGERWVHWRDCERQVGGVWERTVN
jgi:hypothetical protein